MFVENKTTEGGKSVHVLLMQRNHGVGKSQKVAVNVFQRVIFFSFHFYKCLIILVVFSYLIMNSSYLESARFEQTFKALIRL